MCVCVLKPVSIMCVCVCVCVCVCRSLRCPLGGISACFPKVDVFGGGSRWVWSTSIQVGVVYFYPRSTLVLPCWSPQDGGS